MTRTHRRNHAPDIEPWGTVAEPSWRTAHAKIVKRLDRHYAVVADKAALPASAGMRREKRNQYRSHRYRNRLRVRKGMEPEVYDREWLD